MYFIYGYVMRSAHTGLYRGAEFDHVNSIEKGNLIEQFHFTSTIFDLKVIKGKEWKIFVCSFI